jgi:hypothetical protein
VANFVVGALVEHAPMCIGKTRFRPKKIFSIPSSELQENIIEAVCQCVCGSSRCVLSVLYALDVVVVVLPRVRLRSSEVRILIVRHGHVL